MKYYIDSEIILSRKIEPIIFVYIMIIIVITLSLIIFLTLFHYKTYYKVKGIVEGDNYYIRVYIPLDDTNYIVSNDIVRIDRKEYKYKIILIDSEFLIDNNNTYQAILIKVELPTKYKFNNLSLNLQFLKEDKKIIDYIIRR